MVQRNPDFTPDRIFPSLERFLEASTAPRGYVRIELDRAPLDFRYLDKNASALGVFFTAAVPKDSLAPRFTGFGVSRDVAMNTLHFADPAVSLNPEIFLAWYTGWDTQPLQDVLRRIVQRYRDWLGEHTPTLLFGGSAGGFASLVCGLGLEDVVSIAANPQTDLRRYNRALVERWRSACWPGAGPSLDEALTFIPAVTDVVSTYRREQKRGLRNKIIVLQNTGDSDHIDAHFHPLREALDGSGCMRYLLDNWGEGHKAPPSQVITAVLRAATQEDWDSPRWAELGYRPG